MIRWITILGMMAWMIGSAVAWAGFEEGRAAYLKGDYETALREWRKAAEQGDAHAQVALGTMYMGATTGSYDAEVAKWYRKAAEQGHTIAQAVLGGMYRLGYGVPQDFALAYMWLNIAAASGDEAAKDARDDLAKEMTSSQIAEAQRLARECIARNYENC